MHYQNLLASLLLATSFLTGSLPAQDIRHSLFIAGPDFTGILDEENKIVWDSGAKGARDGFVLPDGNVLIAWTKEVREYSPKTQESHSIYSLSLLNNEIGTAQRLDNGNTLITELGKNPRALEIDREGKIAIQFRLEPETDNAHMQTRMARKTSSGRYLVPHLLAFQVKEYDDEGRILRFWKTDLEQLGGRKSEAWPFTAILLPNHNILVTLTHSNQVVELDPDGKVVWHISNADFPQKPFADPCGAQRLPNGNTVIASYGAKEGIKIFEVTPDKKIVWTHTQYRAHEIQILTTNGTPLPYPPLK
ncbi:MAG: hypothetical protein U0905_05985 [Pirellulales bacterium]